MAAWLQGIYMSRAIAACFSKNVQYFERPIELSGKQEPPEAGAAMFGAWAEEFNKNFERKDGEENGD